MKEAPKNRPLLLLLGVAVLVFAATIPWQMQQWKELEKTREERRLQETRVAELRERETKTAAPGDALPADTDARLAALQQQAVRGSTPTLLTELDALKHANLTPPQRANLAGIYQAMEYWDEAYPLARQAVEEAKKSGTERPEPLLRLGYMEMLLGYAQSGLPYFTRAAALAPGDTAPIVAVALAHDHASDLPAAEKALRQVITSEPKNPAFHLLLAQNLARQNKLADTRKELDIAEGLSPAEPGIPLQRAEAFLNESRRMPDQKAALLTQADDAVTRCLQLDPNNLDAHFLKGRIRIDQGKLAEARQEWDGLYTVNPNYPQLRYQFGQLLTRMGERERGNQLLQTFRQEDSKVIEYNRLVTSVGMAKENLTQRRELAQWCAANGRLSRAILEYDQILERKPDDTAARQERDRLRALRQSQVK